MSFSKTVVFDAEFDGFNPTKVHVLCATTDMKAVKDTGDYEKIRKFFSQDKIFVAHNCTRFDIPHLARLVGIDKGIRLVDTLILSWYLEPNRMLHGLESYGADFGIQKPKVVDWDNLTYEEYAHRCREDVKINARLWQRQYNQLLALYGDEESVWHVIDYLQFKMHCAALQEACKWKLDVERCKKGLEDLSKEKESKVEALAKAMPKVPVYKTKTKPVKMYKQDGSMSTAGSGWIELLVNQGLPFTHEEAVKYVSEYKEPNPGSVQQVKDWLYSLGWQPETWKHVRNKETNEIRKIEQVASPKGEGAVCDSIKKLFVKEPALELLEGLSILTHRISILQGFLDNVDDEGYIKAEIQGITNTLRFKHKVAVNLPGVSKPYGDLIRGCLVADGGYELCGSDMSSLEDRTKQHYMWPYDPEYVKEMITPDFDPHIDLGVLANMITQEDATAFKAGDKDTQKRIKPARSDAKAVNYSCTYGVTPKGIVRNTGMKIDAAEALHATYWERNWSLKAIADDCSVKRCLGLTWLYNPVSKMWLTLRHDKDRFSTLNQSTGVYCFDTWIKHFLKKRPQLTGQFHDEVVLCIKKGSRDKCTKLLLDAIKDANEELNLNRELSIDIQFGDNYGAIH